jgi:N-acetylglucosaminyldiphosphoundecaprenol N-acetyl-beta-D-mannosaminyltransferase
MRRVELMGAHLHALTETECIDFILQSLEARRGGWLVTMNLNHLRSYFLESEHRRVYQQATLIVPDGMPLLWASRLKGTPLPERVTGSNLIWSLTRAAAARQPVSVQFSC